MKVTLIDCMGDDLRVVNSARVSFGKESKADTLYVSYQEYEEGDFSEYTIIDEFTEPYFGFELSRVVERDTKLIKYLGENEHYSPFGHCFLSFHVKAPIFVARQLVKHKFLRWNEISRRYVDDEPEFYTPEVWRGKSEDKKQGSEGDVTKEAEGCFGLYTDTLYGHQEDILCLYQNLLEAGVCPEQARMVLPLSTYTEWYWSGSLDAFANMCNLRLKEDTQAETREVAKQISTHASFLFPHSWEALID